MSTIPIDGLPRAELVNIRDLKRVAITDYAMGPAHSTDLDVQVRPLGWELFWPSAPNHVADAVRAHWAQWKDHAFPWPDGVRTWQAQWDGPPQFRGVSATHTSITVRLRNTNKPASGGGSSGGGSHVLGLNVGYHRVWAPGIVHVDLARGAQPWWNQRNGSDYSQNTPASPADADGYPTAMPAEGWWATSVAINQNAYPGGQYTALYDGVGTLAFSGDAVVVSTNPGVVSLNITPNSGFAIRITATQLGNHLRNLRIVPGNGGGGGGGGGSHLLGLNVGYHRIWAPSIVHLDLARGAQPWWNQRNSSDWSQNTHASPVDADGYPMAMPALGWWATTMLSGQSAYQQGRYIATYEGDGTLVFAWDAAVVSSLPGRIELDVTPTGQGIYVQLTATNPANHLRNLRIRLA